MHCSPVLCWDIISPLSHKLTNPDPAVLSRPLAHTRRTTPATSGMASLSGATLSPGSWMMGSCWSSKPRTATAHHWLACCWKVRAAARPIWERISGLHTASQSLSSHVHSVEIDVASLLIFKMVEWNKYDKSHSTFKLASMDKTPRTKTYTPPPPMAFDYFLKSAFVIQSWLFFFFNVFSL